MKRQKSRGFLKLEEEVESNRKRRNNKMNINRV
jgi:hypothetical protein